MKQKLFTLLVLCVFSTTTFAGGIVTNANQSAQYVRMLARDASTSIDAVYYNPAGLTKLSDGFHISINNQSLFQKKTIENKFPLLNESKYVGDVAAPLFPDFYAVYKKNKLALSFGFQPNAGGGSADYKTGLPSFEIPISVIPTMLTLKGMPTSAYSADINFKGTSVFWGAQVNASYAINDMISLSVGARMIFAKNTYDGAIKNILINPNMSAHPLAALMPSYTGGMVSATQFGTDLGNAIRTAYGTTTANAGDTLAARTKDIEVDAEQTGTGYTPIIGANFTFGEKLNVGLRYEFKTKLTLKNNTKVDGSGMFPDKAESRSDIPAILSIGLGYKLTPQLRVSAGVHYYFDENATIESAPGVKKEIDGNLYEIALGGEYDITDKILISAGYLYTKTGVGTGYQTDLTHSLTSSSVGFGGAFKATEKMDINLGMLYTMYTSDAKSIDYSEYGIASAKETYNRTNLGFAIGVDYHF
jgi:long-subunit fatty acid transport protein